jgi:anti-anti-sigma factor
VQLERSESTCRIKVTDDPIFREFNFSRIVLDRLVDSDQHVILDLSMVSSLHSPGLANLVSIHVSLQKRGKTLELTGLNETNRRLLRATNLDRLLTIKD